MISWRPYQNDAFCLTVLNTKNSLLPTARQLNIGDQVSMVDPFRTSSNANLTLFYWRFSTILGLGVTSYACMCMSAQPGPTLDLQPSTI